MTAALLLAHGGVINPWGFAYTGGVIGAIATAMWIVRHNVSIGPDAPRRARLPRWFVPIGFACGVSLGLGAGGLLERLFQSTPDPRAVAAQLCTLAGPNAETSDIHNDLDHLADDLGHAALQQAHIEFHTAATGTHQRAAVTTLIDHLEQLAGAEAGAACAR